MIFYSRSPRSFLAGLASLGGLLAIIKIIVMCIQYLNRWYFDRELKASFGPDKNYKEILSVELIKKMSE